MKRKKNLFGDDGKKRAKGLRPSDEHAATKATIETIDDVLREHSYQLNHKEFFGKTAS